MTQDEYDSMIARELFPEPTRAQKVRAVIGIVLTVILIFVMMTSCVPGEVVASSKTGESIVRNIDEEAGVVCYVYAARGTISCVPLDQTCLDK